MLGAGGWRNAPVAFSESSSVLDRVQSKEMLLNCSIVMCLNHFVLTEVCSVDIVVAYLRTRTSI